jgi:hypothetical protein
MDKPVKVALLVAGCVGVAYFIYTRNSSNNNSAAIRENQIRQVGNIVYSSPNRYENDTTNVSSERTQEERTFSRTNAFNRPVSFLVNDLFAFSRWGTGESSGAVADDISGIADTTMRGGGLRS